MAIDGSFCLPRALETFFDRCPKVSDFPLFSSIANKGVAVDNEEAIIALSEIFLHPEYTIPLVHCFRPIIRRVVGRVVDLLHLVDDLRSSADYSDEGSALENSMKEGISVIDFYVRRGQGLELHECACLAFGRALHLNTSLLGSILNYFEKAPPPYERILVKEIISETQMEVALRVSYRFLVIKPEVFSKLWDWSSFLNSMRRLSDCRKPEGQTLKKHQEAVWCGMQILSIVLRCSDQVSGCFGLDVEQAFSCLLRWEEFCQDVEIEKAGLYIELATDMGLSSPQQLSFLLSGRQNQQPAGAEKAEPLMKIRRSVRPFSEPFHIHSSVEKSFEMVSLAVSQKRPVLLYGPSGSGKSALIKKLADESGNHVVFIHMDDQLDGKTLVGTYVCADQPGEFKWQPGSLTQAIINGFWVVLEDIDKAPSDVPLVLSPLLGGSCSFVTSHGEEIRIAESFQLFSTISTPECSVSHIREAGNSLSPLWRRIVVYPPDRESLQYILLAWYKDLRQADAEKLIETFESANSALRPQFSGLQTENPATSSSPCRFSLRDLLKLCERVHDLSSDDGHAFYQEAADIFSASYMSPDNRMTVNKILAKIWRVAIPEDNHKPQIQEVQQGFYRVLKIGRVSLQLGENASHDRSRFVETRTSTRLLEKIARSVECNEPVLLVGETGTGKTTLVQNLAHWIGQKLTVLNLSQQSDIVDLLGGFKPIDAKFTCTTLYNKFIELARDSKMKDDSKIMKWLQKAFRAKKWDAFLSGLKKTIDHHIEGKSGEERSRLGRKRKKREEIDSWTCLSQKVEKIHQMICSGGMVFTFVEGAFVTALRDGHWVLLDEVNLAPPEILGRLIGVLEGVRGSLCLAERGDVMGIPRHMDFRLFACMNPATDAGKRDLPFSFRSRFTEYVVDDELSDVDLEIFVRQFLGGRESCSKLVGNIVWFYKEAKRLSEESLQDGANQKPQYSLRSLYRALEYARKAEGIGGFQKALFDGFSMFFLSLLDASSAKIMYPIIQRVSKEISASGQPLQRYLGDLKGSSDGFVKSYVKTKSVVKHLNRLAQAIFIKKYPVLLQGPTSSGKTSLVKYLAAVSGSKFVRINNHEQTDIQEYLGSYMTDSSGKLVFHEGALVKAVRDGHWIVLDELNLAPSDVLEALNRLLDDNRELFVPELRETISAHPNFMLFATQNPPTLYGGRKILSRAFRNRFVEIHVDEIPEDELSEILTERCHIAKSHASKMVEVMKDLQRNRQSSKAFAGKHGYITPRDLFRWADRFRTFGKCNEDLAREGYYLLAERLRDDTEKVVVQEVLERQLRVSLAKDALYKKEFLGLDQPIQSIEDSMQNRKITWTQSMWRLFFLIRRSYELREPVLLVGDTGGGKTTICQLLSNVLGLRLHILNCHQYTETSDFLGGFFPVRDRSNLVAEYENQVKHLKLSEALTPFGQDIEISEDIGKAELLIKSIDLILGKYKDDSLMQVAITQQNVDVLEKIKNKLVMLYQKWRAIFVWQDGPLVEAMRAGNLFLVDEISLADDSVLERLNSVLEPGRKLSLAEKGGPVLEEIVAHKNFLVLATMNPGGDYGKKELSPALRNRFTEIWVPPITDTEELRSIAFSGLSDSKELNIVDPIVNFWEWFNKLETGRMLTVRDLLSWVAFVNVTRESLGPVYAILHGAFLVLLDGLSLGTGISGRDGKDLREKCFSFLSQQLKVFTSDTLPFELSGVEQYGWGDAKTICQKSNSFVHGDKFGIDPFYVRKGDENSEIGGFEFLAPTTRRNVLRVLRAMQLSKPILLEGSPGVGKTSLIMALGKYSGHKVVRINLSEQTDMMDLLGSDLPIESDEDMKFAWSDGILLQALKQGSWVLLDELNLAPQSVLEGLNAILDHRAEVFIPELGYTFECPPAFRVFACQNPSSQGGGRKGLPKSFLNRFTKVYVDELVEDDYLFICRSLYPSIPSPLLSKLIALNRQLHDDTMLNRKFGQDGSPWEFNLRDVIRSCQFMQGAINDIEGDSFLSVLYVQRMRTATDRKEVLSIYETIFDRKPSTNPYPRVQLNPGYVVVGSAAIKRNSTQSNISGEQLKILPEIRQNLEAVAHCVWNQWLCILVGPSSSGKTSLLRILAQLTGYPLNELNLSSVTDSSDLLGCFEQYNAFRNFRLVINRVEHLVDEYNSLLSRSSCEALLSEKNGIVTCWLSFLYKIDSNLSANPSSFLNDSDSLSKLIEIVEYLNRVLEEGVLSVSWSKKNLDQIMKTILKLQTHEQKQSTKFEWVTGMLIKAIENGEWVVLENANLCNPTVLDRINSLVEPCGSITLNECGIIDGEPVTVIPHPNFRLFLSVNPKFGEVSRAMRNRGVEVFMMGPHWQLNEEGSNSEELVLRGVERFLALSGIPGYKLVASMAKAHVHAWRNGQSFSVRITYLELEQWVHLFQLLLMNGNQLMWSLQLSWEHIYLSSLGVTDGKEVVDFARHAYLSNIELSEHDSFMGGGLCLPGGWPKPLNLRDFTWHSRETTVRQNCMYLEFLGAQYASHQSQISYNMRLRDRELAAGESRIIYTIDSLILKKILYPRAGSGSTASVAQFKNDLASKMLLYAANWTMEQATEEDIQLYLVWISWFGSKVQPHCQFFLSFLNMLKDEFKHPIWNQIYECRKDLKSLSILDPDVVPIPLLSFKLVDVAASIEPPKPYSKCLFESLKSIGVLRLSYQQWLTESNYNHSDVSCYIHFLDSLRALEKKVLFELVGSPSFSVLIQLYAEVIQKHTCFWSGLVSSSEEYLLFSFWSLIKAVKKLLEFFPEEVQVVLEESRNINNIALHGRPEKSLLWAYGGHPSMPVSAVLHRKQQKLLQLCSTVWPINLESDEQGNDHVTKAIALSGPQLCLLALEGLCISSYITDKDDEDYGAAIQLDEIYQTLLERLKLEKKRLEEIMGASKSDKIGNRSAVCCDFCPEIVSTGSGFSSWVKICFIAKSESCSLDVELLPLLQNLLVDRSTEPLDLVDLRNLLKPALEYSLSSARPPQTLVAHQKLLWAIDARDSVLGVDTKIADYVLEMWYWWHSVLWKNSQINLMSISDMDNCRNLSPSILIQPVKTAAVVQILQNAFSVKDYHLESMNLRYGSQQLWKSSQPSQEMPESLLSIARSHFQQIIYAHKKSFEPNNFAAIKTAFHAIEKKQYKVDDIQFLISLIGSSSHQRLRSVTNSIVGPLAKHLYSECSSNEFHSNLGLAWLYLGALRFHLLNSLDVIDPAMKVTCKLLELEDKISSLELNIKVRGECEYLSGLLYFGENDENVEHTLYELKTEHKRLQRKVIFRSDSKKYQDLRRALDEFAGFLTRPISLVNDLKVLDWNQVVEQVFNWQETASSLINRLFNEYSEYADITQPIQVSVYEMKLGLSLFISGSLLRNLLNKIDIDMVSVMETIYALMRFPRGCSSGSATNLQTLPPLHFSHCADSRAKSLGLDVCLLQKLISVSSAEDSKKVSELQLKIVLYKNLHARVLHFVSNTGLMDKASFELLDKIYFELSRIWMEVKFQAKSKADSISGIYKFRSRDFKIESVMEVDISALGKYFPNDSFLEWQEYLADDDINSVKKTDQDEENLEDEWDLIQEHLDDIYSTHNELFGFDNLSESGGFCITESRRLDSFTDSYGLGISLIKGLRGLFTSSLDAKLVPEHLLRLCLEYKKNFTSYHHSANKYNFYKDFDGPELGKMVKVLSALQERIYSLLQEQEDHPGLQKLSDVLRMLLGIPSSTPLAKALSGLQFLLCKVRKLQEEGCKLPLSDLLDPISALASSWQRMEFERWPTLLDEVQDQYEFNARKLWLPLFSVLFQEDCAEISEHDEESISQSLVKFVETSNIGDFRKRLQLLFCFLLQLSMGNSLGIYSSDLHKKKVEICYNVFGFYIQFLPVVMEQVDSNRRNVEAELKEVLKLCRWERPDSFMSIESTKRTRQKVKKLIQKFTDMLRPSVMLVRPDLSKERVQFLPLLSSALMEGASDMKVEVLVSALDAKQLSERDRFSWVAVWRDKLKESVGSFEQEMHHRKFKVDEDFIAVINQLPKHQCSPAVYQDDWKSLWNTVATIGETIAGCSDLWRDSDRDVAKKRGLSELLKLLESSGLQKHKFENVEISTHFKGLLYQPAYDPKHLLPLTHSKGSMHLSRAVEDENKESSLVEWRMANEFYFKSLASVQVVLNIERKHSDVTSEQIKRSISFLNHLVEIQRQQRRTAYGFSELLNRFRQHVLSLAKLLGDSTGADRKDDSVFSFPKNQHAIFNCLWLQKQLFDNITAMLLDESVLLRTIGCTHLDSCQAVKASSTTILSIIEKLIPIAQNSKASLDRLLGCTGSFITPSCYHNQFATQHMVQLLRQNFDQLTEVENQISTSCEDNEKSYVRDVLLSHFASVFKEGKLLAEKLNCILDAGDQSTGMEPKEQFRLEENLASTFFKIKEVIGKLCSYKEESVLQEKEGNITSWDGLFKKAENDLNLDDLCYLLSQTFGSIEHLFNSSSVLSACVGNQLKHLHAFLDLLVFYGDCYLNELVAISKTVSLITHVLASVLADLFTKGFGISKNDEDDGSKAEKPEAAEGTGMGEGVGAKDVSDQIEDEDQLRGTAKKEEEEEEQDPSDDLLGKNKGIEMTDEFDGKEHDVSEDSEDDKEEEESEDDKLDSAIGEVGSGADIADEKPWNKDEDEDQGSMNEKNESGPSVADKDTSSRELRAKDDGVDTADELEESNTSDKMEEGNDENGDQDTLGDTEELEDKIQNKEEALADPPEVTSDVGNKQIDDDMEIDETDEAEKADADHQEEPFPEDQKHSAESENDQETQEPVDETMEAGDEDTLGTPQKDESGNDLEEKSETDPIEGKGVTSEDMKQNFSNDNISGVDSGSQNPYGSNVLGAGSMAPEENLSAANATNELMASMDLPTGTNSEMNLMVTSLLNGETLTNNIPKMEYPQNQSSTAQQTKVNPYRNVGDALKEWKERVRVSSDLGEKQEAESEVEDPDAAEYGYASQLDAGTSQALGPALPEQVNTNMRETESEEERLAGHEDEVSAMDTDDMSPENKPAAQSKPVVRNSISEQVQAPDRDRKQQENSSIQNFGEDNGKMDSLVSVDSVSLGDAYNPDCLQLTDKDLQDVQDNDEDPDARNKAVVLWRRCELLTARPSQELAEQLRLILEPTLASKLTGDYRTGKRINMKKVIPYIASHYRKDKIWLRRTKPNKRDYQVVIAVDDSRSMSESGCSDFAIRALTTVCRAMSQLEMGSLAVASFGKEGSMKILHDFGQSFSTESGIKMISSLTFKQENLIEDEPVVNLLKNMNKMLDDMATKKQHSTNPLQQLVLIIGDGKFHEREKLKRAVRNFLHQKRMVVYLLLDNSEQSVLDIADFVYSEDRSLKKMKYLDSFPFPYYIVLRDIEALPRTLGDLLRQWFELMQNSRQ